MSGVASSDAGGTDALRARLDGGLRRIAFFVVPSAVAFLALGDVVAAALLQTGRFTHDDAIRVWGDSRGLGGRAAGLDAGSAVLLDLLRASRYPDAFAVRDRPRRADDGPRVSVRVSAPAAPGHSDAVWRRRTDRVGGHRRMGRDAAPAFDAQRAHRSNRIAGGLRRTALGSGGRRRRRSRGAIKLALPVSHPIVAAIAVLGPYGCIFFAVTSRFAFPRRRRRSAGSVRDSAHSPDAVAAGQSRGRAIFSI